jgi:hypothetical protein
MYNAGGRFIDIGSGSSIGINTIQPTQRVHFIFNIFDRTLSSKSPIEEMPPPGLIAACNSKEATHFIHYSNNLLAWQGHHITQAGNCKAANIMI